MKCMIFRCRCGQEREPIRRWRPDAISIAAKWCWRFFDCLGPLRFDFLDEGATINAMRYIQTLTELKKDISNKMGNRPKPHILLHDNARPHTAATHNTDCLEAPLWPSASPAILSWFDSCWFCALSSDEEAPTRLHLWKLRLPGARSPSRDSLRSLPRRLR